MKHLTSVLFLLSVIFFVVPGPAHAQLGSNSPEKLAELTSTPQSAIQTAPASNTSSAVRPVDRSANIQTRALNEIQRRIVSLTKVLAKVTSMMNLSTDTKTALSAQIQGEIDELTALQTQLESETDQTVISETAQTVVTSYRTYAVFLPKVRIILAGEGILMLSEKMIGIQERLSMQVSDLTLDGVDTSAMEQTLIDVEESITTAQTNANEAIDLVTPLSPEEYPENRSIFQDSRTLLRDARLSLVSARDSLGDLVQSITTAKGSEDAMTDAMESDEVVTDEMTSTTQSTTEDSLIDTQTAN